MDGRSVDDASIHILYFKLSQNKLMKFCVERVKKHRWRLQDTILQICEDIDFVNADGLLGMNEEFKLRRKFQDRLNWKDHHKTFIVLFPSRKLFLSAEPSLVDFAQRQIHKIVLKFTNISNVKIFSLKG